jgi:peptidoglycan/LPS O-acetylase OafA/YrhL
MAAAAMHPKRRGEERAERLAGFLSNLGVAAVIAGFIGPSFGGGFSVFEALGAVLAGLVLHGAGQYVPELAVPRPRDRDAS